MSNVCNSLTLLFFGNILDSINCANISTEVHLLLVLSYMYSIANILKSWPGTLAACCKPSSGAGAVWMEIPLRGRVHTSAMKNGDRLKVILPKSHYTRALRTEQPEERKPEESLCKCNHKSATWSARSRVRSPRTTKFFGHSSLRNLAIMMKIEFSCAYSVLVEPKSLLLWQNALICNHL